MKVSSRSLKLLLVSALWLVIAFLLWLTWRTIDWRTLAEILSQLTIPELGILFLINVGLFLLMSVRWWWILRVMGYPISIITLTRCRLTAFGINYFTPGPQFGGEPFQIYVLHKRLGVPIQVSAASVAFDKLVELLANFIFLVIGFAVIVQFGILGVSQGFLFFSLISLVILVVILYLISIYLNRSWAGGLIERLGGLSEGSPFWSKIFQTIAETEREAAQAVRARPGLFVISLGLSALTWVALVYEYRLALVYLGSALPLPQTIGVLTAARIAFLFPFPGGLGSLEISQVLAMQALGASAALGISMGLLIRVRDILFGGVGLLLEGFPLPWRSKNPVRSASSPGTLDKKMLSDSSDAVEEVLPIEIVNNAVASLSSWTPGRGSQR